MVGTIESMHWDARSRDVRIRLKGDACGYYVNRGLDMGMDSTSWDKAWTDQKVTLQVGPSSRPQLVRKRGARAGRNLGSGHAVPNRSRGQSLGG